MTVATNRLLLGVRGERSRFPCDQTGGGRRSPRLPFALVVFFALASSFGVARLLATLLVSPPGLSPLPVSVRNGAPQGTVPRHSFVGVSEAPARSRRVRQTPPVFDAEAFYRTIIDNNLFRPLGWTPPRPIEPYRLIGTLLPRSDTTPPKAIIQTTAGNKTYIVSTGEPLDALTEVVSIESKHITLQTNGQQRTLHLPSGF